MDVNRDIQFLLIILIVSSTVALLFGAITVERWLMIQVLILSYLAPSPILHKDKNED